MLSYEGKKKSVGVQIKSIIQSSCQSHPFIDFDWWSTEIAASMISLGFPLKSCWMNHGRISTMMEIKWKQRRIFSPLSCSIIDWSRYQCQHWLHFHWLCYLTKHLIYLNSPRNQSLLRKIFPISLVWRQMTFLIITHILSFFSIF